METQQLIIKKLDKIEKEIGYIKDHMVDADTILTNEERKLLDESIQHEKEGTLVSLVDLEDVRNKAR